MDLSQLKQRPAPNEYAAYYETYISLVQENCIEMFSYQVTELTEFFDTVTDEQASTIHAPYSWTIKQVLGHVIDTERVFAARLHHIAAGDTQPLPNMDQALYASGFDFDLTSVEHLVEEFKHCRLANTLLVRRVLPSSWDNRAMAAGNSVSARALAWMLLGHVVYHMRIVRARLGR